MLQVEQHNNEHVCNISRRTLYITYNYFITLYEIFVNKKMQKKLKNNNFLHNVYFSAQNIPDNVLAV